MTNENILTREGTVAVAADEVAALSPAKGSARKKPSSRGSFAERVFERAL